MRHRTRGAQWLTVREGVTQGFLFVGGNVFDHKFEDLKHWVRAHAAEESWRGRGLRSGPHLL